jgi:hypothetical protein
LHHAPVVDVTAGGRVEPPGDDDHDWAHAVDILFGTGRPYNAGGEDRT